MTSIIEQLCGPTGKAKIDPIYLISKRCQDGPAFTIRASAFRIVGMELELEGEVPAECLLVDADNRRPA